MANELRRRVHANPGHLLQDLERGRPHYVGYDVLTDPDAPADYQVPGGNRYRIKPEGQLVLDCAYIRSALTERDRSGQTGLLEQPHASVRAAAKKSAPSAPEKGEG